MNSPPMRVAAIPQTATSSAAITATPKLLRSEAASSGA